MSLKIATWNLHVFLCFLLLHFKKVSLYFHNIPCAKRSMTNKQLSNSYLHFKPEESFPNAMGKPKRVGKGSLKRRFLGLSKHPSYLWSCNQRSIFFSIWFYLPWHGTDFLSHRQLPFLNHLYSHWTMPEKSKLPIESNYNNKWILINEYYSA